VLTKVMQGSPRVALSSKTNENQAQSPPGTKAGLGGKTKSQRAQAPKFEVWLDKHSFDSIQRPRRQTLQSEPRSSSKVSHSEGSTLTADAMVSPEVDWESLHSATNLGEHSDAILNLLCLLHGDRVQCEKCLFSFCSKFSSIIPSSPELQDSVVEAISKAPKDAMAANLATSVELSRTYVHLARVQLRYALGVFLDHLERLDIAEQFAHEAVHNDKELHEQYGLASEGISLSIYEGACILSQRDLFGTNQSQT
jgi:hypothetical protein